MNMLSLFSGIGGLDLAAEWAGMKTVAFCERDKFCQKVLAKHWPAIPCFGDVTTLKGSDVNEPIDLISAGYPCQPFSVAGRRKGKDDDRYLWPECSRIIDELRPPWFVGENVAGHITNGLDAVCDDLESKGYAVQTYVFPASAVGAYHRRDRCFVVANAKCTTSIKRPESSVQRRWSDEAEQTRVGGSGNDATNANIERCEKFDLTAKSEVEGLNPWCTDSSGRMWAVEPDVGGALDGFSAWLDGHGGLIGEAHKCIMANGISLLGDIHDATSTRRRAGEILRVLRDTLATEGDQWTIGGSGCIPPSQVLLAYVRKLETNWPDETRLQLASTETPKASMRGVRSGDEPDSTPHRPRQDEQHTTEHTDAVQALSRLLARHAEKAWVDYRRRNAEAVRHWESGIARVAHGVRGRMDRLKSLGNAVVPQQAYPIFKAIMDIERMAA